MSLDLSLTPAQHDLVERTHRFAEQEIRPVAAHYDAEQEFPWPVLEAAAREGFYNPLFYRDLIGDPTGLSLPVFMEELFWGCAGIGLSIVMPALALSAMGQAATPEQLLRWAPECFGEPGDLKLAALCVSEPQGGSDVRNLQTQARRDGDDWVIDGHKIWIGNGGIANVHVVNADRRSRARPPRPGAVHRARRDARAWRWCASSTSSAAAPRTPPSCASRTPRPGATTCSGGDAQLEHKLREGAAAGERSSTLGAFEQTRPMVAAQALGIARAALEYATEYATEREAFGGPIIDKQGVSFPLADLAADLDAARLLTWRASWMAAQRVPFQHGEGSMSKLKASEVAVRATEQACSVRRLGLRQRPPGREVVPRRQALHDLRGHERDPAVVIGRALGGAAGEPPLHHQTPTDGPPLSKAIGRGTPARARVGMAGLKAAEKTPKPVLRVVMNALKPPKGPSRRGGATQGQKQH